MSGAQIAKEISRALADVARSTGDGFFKVSILRPGAQPANPWDTPAGARDEVKVRAMVEDYQLSHIDGTLIQAGDKRVMLDATVIVPTTADRITLADGEYSIVRVTPFAPSGVALYYVLQCRR